MTGRQAQFGGEEAPPPHLAIDLDRLAAWLAPRLPGMDLHLSLAKFKGGQSNPTYRLSGPGGDYVLRRKPPGTLLPSAHRIDREYRILSALRDSGVPIPGTHGYCADPGVIGSEFYIVDHVAGRVFWEADMGDASRSERIAVYDDMNRLLAMLHDLDPAAIGLSDLAPPDGYAARNLARWSKNYVQSCMTKIADMDWLIDRLPQHVPETAQTRFIHGDYGLYNLIIAQDTPRIVAVLDWEMATLGDPLIDLAHHLRAWWDLPDSGLAATSLYGRDVSALGIPTMEAYVALYCARRGIAVPDLRWYLAFAQFRYAAMVQGILKRAADGTASSRVMVHSQNRVRRIAAMARMTLEG
ncbi:phosphotransferase family protein [Sphingobium sp.]|uniref:phosphotransferase family protein n=1 Tax=Sphingobium sp. TaxID=1912891 RepID=UPI002C104884|nr:phosphotransferase family protein [Sphingobium sp.]HUD92380.1 phosphotransferase family protein [Sphingobium sp.]